MIRHKSMRFLLIFLSLCFAAAAIYKEIFIMDDSLGLTLIYNICSVILIYIHFKTAEPVKREKASKIYLIYALTLYLVLLSSLLFIDVRFLRNETYDGSMFSYVNSHINLIPFHTIMLYLNGYKNGSLLFSELLINLLGNILAFMPIGFLLPRIFKKLNNAFLLIVAAAGFICFVEIMQLVLRTGICDVDDLILNLFGASLVYFVTRRIGRKNRRI